jgi:hypoxanthine phosphoribosyltransferase
MPMELLIPASKISDRINVLAETISREYTKKNLHIVVILKGAFIFAADMTRRLTIPFNIDFVRASTYGNSHKPVVKPKIDLDQYNVKVKGQDILIVDDIIDTGNTLSFLVEEIHRRNCNSVKLCTLLNKPSRREADIHPDFCGFDIKDLFVVGFGLDYAEKYRCLPDIYMLNNDDVKKG